MPRTPKPTDHLDSVKHLMGTMPDHEIAALCNSTPSIVGRYRRRLGIPAYEGYKFGMGQEPPSKKREDEEAEAAAEAEAEKPVEKAEKAAPKGRSKLDAFLDVIGQLSDAEVAARAGVTAEAVRIYRRRHGLASRRDNARAEATESKAAVSTPPARREASRAEEKADSAAKTAQRRLSKLDDYMDLVGTLPDREVATMAGVTPENVRAFRRRHNIPARWRNEGAESASQQVEAPVVVEAAPVEAPAAKKGRAAKPAAVEPEPVVEAAPVAVQAAPEVEAAPVVAAPRTTLSRQGYAVHVRVGDTVHEYLIVATDIASAATNAIVAVATRHADAEITSIRHLGPALV